MVWKGFGRTVTDEMIEKQCKYCQFYVPEGEWGCGTKTYCKIDMIIAIENNHCKSFSPETMFGICRECEHRNVFKPPIYCDCKEQPNMRKVYNSDTESYKGCSRHLDYHTCDNYTVKERQKEYILNNLVAGCCPANFDPDTWQSIEEWQKEGVLVKIEQLIVEEKERQKEGQGKKDRYKQVSIFNIQSK